MERWQTFSFRISENERQLIVYLASALQRKPGDAVRQVVIERARELLARRIPDEHQALAFTGESVSDDG